MGVRGDRAAVGRRNVHTRKVHTHTRGRERESERERGRESERERERRSGPRTVRAEAAHGALQYVVHRRRQLPGQRAHLLPPSPRPPCPHPMIDSKTAAAQLAAGPTHSARINAARSLLPPQSRSTFLDSNPCLLPRPLAPRSPTQTIPWPHRKPPGRPCRGPGRRAARGPAPRQRHAMRRGLWRRL